MVIHVQFLKPLCWFWAIFVRCRRQKPCLFINLVHQPADARKLFDYSVLYFSSFDIFRARNIIKFLVTIYPLSRHAVTNSLRSFSRSESLATPVQQAFFVLGISSKLFSFFFHSLTCFSLTPNSRAAAQFLLAFAKLTTWSLKAASYVDRFCLMAPKLTSTNQKIKLIQTK